MVLLLVFMQLTRDLFAIAKFLLVEREDVLRIKYELKENLPLNVL